VIFRWKNELKEKKKRLHLKYVRNKTKDFVGLEVLPGVVMKFSILWDKTPCSTLRGSRLFGGTCLLHLQDRRISQARNKRESSSNQILKIEATFSSETSVAF
jgi:hypothetical protein